VAGLHQVAHREAELAVLAPLLWRGGGLRGQRVWRTGTLQIEGSARMRKRGKGARLSQASKASDPGSCKPRSKPASRRWTRPAQHGSAPAAPSCGSHTRSALTPGQRWRRSPPAGAGARCVWG
jgi:hypothetical protein